MALPEDIPDHIRDTMTITIANMALEAEKLQLTLQQIIWRARSAGMDLAEIELMLLEDLRTGGQLFGDFRKNFKSQMRYTIEEVARGEIYETHKDVKLWEWVAISDKLLCPDCANRNRTICQRACRCMLSPKDSISIPKEGIIRGK
jgi:hypothetical protein